MRRPRLVGLLTLGAVLATGCGGTYHPESPDAVALVEVTGNPAGRPVTAQPDGAEASTSAPIVIPTGPSGSTSAGSQGGAAGPSQPAPDSPSVTGGSQPSEPEAASTDGPSPSAGAGSFPVADIGAERPANSGGRILLGIVGPHTGPIALQGLASLRGVQAAIADYNARGGIQGVPIELLIEDDQFDPAQGRRYVQRMINQDKIFAMMGLVTPATFAQSLPDFEASGTLMMLGDGGASTGGSRLVFPSYQLCPTAMGGAAEYAIRDLGLSRLAILEIDIELSRTCANAIAETAEQLGAQVVFRTGVTPGGIGCGSQAQGAADSGAETVLIQAETLTMIRCIQALRQQGFQGQIGLSANAIDDDALVEALEAQAEGIYSTSGLLPKTHPIARAQCIDLIDTYYPDSGATQYLGANACLAARILLDALTVLGPDATAREVIGYLERGEPYLTEGWGPPLRYSRDNHEPHRELRGLEIRNGNWEPMTDLYDPVWGR